MKIINVSQQLGDKVFTWTRDYLFKVLTEGEKAPLKNGKLIAAFRMVDRKDFVPREFEQNAYEDRELNIGFEESLTRPTVLAKMAELMNPKPGGKYLDIGSGTGYFAAVVGFVAGETGQVLSLERVQWLWETSRLNLQKYPDIKNVKILYQDGMNGLPNEAPFDGIHVSFAMSEIPETLKMQLNPNGARLVVPTPNNDLRVIERHGENDFFEEIVPGYIFAEGKEGKV